MEKSKTAEKAEATKKEPTTEKAPVKEKAPSAEKAPATQKAPTTRTVESTERTTRGTVRMNFKEEGVQPLELSAPIFNADPYKKGDTYPRATKKKEESKSNDKKD